MKIEDYLIGNENYEQQKLYEQYLTKEVLDYFFLTDGEWNNYSSGKRNEVAEFYFTYIKHQRFHHSVSSQIPKDWKTFSIDDKMSAMQEIYKLNIFHLKYLKNQKIRQEEKNKLEEEKKRRREEDKIKRELEEEKKKVESQKIIEEKEKLIRLQKQQQQQKFEQSEILHNKRIADEERYKNKIKTELLRKEREKKLSSDAVKELIEDGLLTEYNDNVFERLPIPNYVKNAVWQRDKECCSYCKSNINLEFDHIIPISKGGSNTIQNLQLLCRVCNRRKSNKI